MSDTQEQPAPETPEPDAPQVGTGGGRLTRVITLDPRAATNADIISGLEQLLENLREDVKERPDLFIRFQTDPDIDLDEDDEQAEPSNDLAKALEEQADKQDNSLTHVNDFAKAVQTAMRKNGISNCAWVVVVAPDKTKPEDKPRFITGGTDRTHAWFRESLELAANMRMMRAQIQQRAAAGVEGMKVNDSGLIVPDENPVAAPTRPKLVI